MKDKQPKWSEKNIATPRPNDILLGRGGTAIHNDANVRYRSLVKAHKKAYQMYTRLQKTQLAESLVREWQQQDPPGRFLELDAKTTTWYCINEKSARRKTSQLLREGAPKIRRELKAESLSSSTPPKQKTFPPVRTPSPPPSSETSPAASPSRITVVARRPSRTPVSKVAKAKLRGNHKSVPTSNADPLVTPNRDFTTMPPLLQATPRMTTPSPQLLATPPPVNRENWPLPVPQQRWQQQWQTPYYDMTTQTPFPYYSPPPPAATTNSPAPLRPITPADTNQRNTCGPYDTMALAKRAALPKLTRPPLVERKFSISKPFEVERMSSAPSPESVLELFEFELCELPIASWDCSDEDPSGDVISLSSLPPEEDDTNLLHLSPRSTVTMEFHRPARLSPPRMQFRKDHSYLDTETFQSYSFDSFDRMESLIQAENLDTSTIDILNELDKELEGELLLRPCHSL